MTLAAFSQIAHHVASPARSTATIPATSAAQPLACAVRLVDRRTGQTHRINGRPLVLYTRNPADAVADLLEGRDPSVWEARIEPIEGRVRQ